MNEKYMKVARAYLALDAAIDEYRSAIMEAYPTGTLLEADISGCRRIVYGYEGNDLLCVSEVKGDKGPLDPITLSEVEAALDLLEEAAEASEDDQ